MEISDPNWDPNEAFASFETYVSTRYLANRYDWKDVLAWTEDYKRGTRSIIEARTIIKIWAMSGLIILQEDDPRDRLYFIIPK